MWKPSVDRSALAKRAQILVRIREFFAEHDVLEVDVPVIASHGVTDPNLTNLSTSISGQAYFLQTSPEFFMKRLLAGGSGSIYYLGKAFRDDELGRRHNPEFTMLEWYREDFDEMRLAAEVVNLIRSVSCSTVAAHYHTYAELFMRHCGIDPHSSSSAELEQRATSLLDVSWSSQDKNTWLDLLFSHIVEPTLDDLTVVYDYPSSQCALAKVESNRQGVAVAKRFEVFWQGLELANGYLELIDPQEQKARFESDLKQREAMQLSLPTMDMKFIGALESGLPACSGVAMGVDRLMMCVLGADDISDTLAFPFSHV